MLPTDLHLEFGDGTYRFALLLPQQLELERVCGFTDRDGNQRRRGIVGIYSDIIAGLGVIGSDIIADPTAGRASAFECREVIRLALIGGAKGDVNGSPVEVTPVTAKRLVETYIDQQPIMARWTLAAAILRAAVEGFDRPKAEPAKAPAKPRARRTKGSATTRSSSTPA